MNNLLSNIYAMKATWYQKCFHEIYCETLQGKFKFEYEINMVEDDYVIHVYIIKFQRKLEYVNGLDTPHNAHMHEKKFCKPTFLSKS